MEELVAAITNGGLEAAEAFFASGNPTCQTASTAYSASASAAAGTKLERSVSASTPLASPPTLFRNATSSPSSTKSATDGTPGSDHLFSRISGIRSNPTGAAAATTGYVSGLVRRRRRESSQTGNPRSEGGAGATLPESASQQQQQQQCLSPTSPSAPSPLESSPFDASASDCDSSRPESCASPTATIGLDALCIRSANGTPLLSPENVSDEERQLLNTYRELDMRRMVQIQKEHAHLLPLDSPQLSIEEWREVYAHVWSMFVRVHPPYGRWKRLDAVNGKPYTHACNSECMYIYNYREVYICLFSEFVHRCTEYTCDLAISGTEMRSCPFTSKVYALEFVNTWDQGGRSDDYMRMFRTTVAGPSQKQLRHDKRERVNANVASTRYTDVSTDRVFEVAAMVRRFLIQGPIEQKERLASQISPTIVHLYRDFLALRTPPSTYTLEFHTWLMMRFMGRGGVGGIYGMVVPSIRELADLIPADDTVALKQLSRNCSHATHTNADKIFKETMLASMMRNRSSAPSTPAASASAAASPSPPAAAVVSNSLSIPWTYPIQRRK